MLRSPSSHASQMNSGPQIVTKEHVLRACVFSVIAKIPERKACVSSYSFFPILSNMQSLIDEKQVEGLCTEKTLDVFYAVCCKDCLKMALLNNYVSHIF